jgi:ubiquinone/menaquinone biosynthesis C-methylase UbiE
MGPAEPANAMDDTDYALGRNEAEHERLLEQGELLRPLTRRAFEAAGIGPGMRVLDVGCGAGDVAFLVGEMVGAEGSVLGVDLDGTAVELADARRAAQRVGNVAFRCGDARSRAFGGPFDAVVGRFVLMFMTDATAALAHFANQLRPGGVAVFHEWVARVHGVSSTQQPVLAALLELLSETFARSGASLSTGAELYWRMLDAGLEPEPKPLAEISVSTGTDTPGPRRWALLTRSLLPKAIDYGLVTDAELDIETLEQRLRDEFLGVRGVMPLTYLMVGQWGRKPS